VEPSRPPTTAVNRRVTQATTDRDDRRQFTNP